jgi:hypothetical protein
MMALASFSDNKLCFKFIKSQKWKKPISTNQLKAGKINRVVYT